MIYILDGFEKTQTPSLYQTLIDHFSQKDVEVLHTAEEKMPFCCGSFDCWVKTPGECIMPRCRTIVKNLVRSNLLIFFTPILFGGYPACLKRAVDHIIPAITPFFTRKEGETHHVKRYKTYPSFLSFGFLPKPDARQEAVYRNLFERNRRNFYPPHSACCIFYENQDGTQQTEILNRALQEVGFGEEVIV